MVNIKIFLLIINEILTRFEYITNIALMYILMVENVRQVPFNIREIIKETLT